MARILPSKVVLDDCFADDHIAKDNLLPVSRERDAATNAHEKYHTEAGVAQTHACGCASCRRLAHPVEKDQDYIVLSDATVRVCVAVSGCSPIDLDVIVPELVKQEAHGIVFEWQGTYDGDFEFLATSRSPMIRAPAGALERQAPRRMLRIR